VADAAALGLDPLLLLQVLLWRNLEEQEDLTLPDLHPLLDTVHPLVFMSVVSQPQLQKE
jgi:hypothetical protein